MFIFLIGTAALVAANLLTDHQAQREGLNELQGRYLLGS